MLKIENVEIAGLEPAIRGMRNPKNSWDKSDSACCTNSSVFTRCGDCTYYKAGMCHADAGEMETNYILGPIDQKLAMSLAKGGPVHAKYRRMITVYLDITAPLYWWKEFDTYKVGTVANSCSTMHKIHDKEFTLDDFSHEHLVYPAKTILHRTIDVLNCYRDLFNHGDELDPACEVPRTKLEVYNMTKKDAWMQMIQLLPSSYNQKRTVMLNYEVLHNIYFSRKDHKLDEWHTLCDWIETLPYSELITCKGDNQ